ncbi:unnamed protein product [Blepharisma stoltei]|uniref:Uncharacterized protein n=1 Tax=Blepharisma stoltei TaxID=1481888 RepID=A0AAU9IAW1_9CILI|nr:unnamed protein product [Blepharisma stoltei]
MSHHHHHHHHHHNHLDGAFDNVGSEAKYVSMDSDRDREGFVRKVYGILSAQLIFTSIVVTIVMQIDDFQTWFVDNMWFLFTLIGIEFVCLCFLLCSKKLARKVPTNYIILSIFTLCESLIVGAIASFYDPVSVFIAALMTLGATLGLTAYAMYAKQNFNALLGILFSFVFSILIFGILIAIFFDTHALDTLICLGWVVIYSIYIVIDTQLILGNGKYGLSNEDYIPGALFLYIDIIRLFIYILALFGNKK